jgi:hypothetical protein
MKVKIIAVVLYCLILYGSLMSGVYIRFIDMKKAIEDYYEMFNDK